MPAGPVGSVWASGSWSNTAWEANTWADAVVIVPAVLEFVGSAFLALTVAGSVVTQIERTGRSEPTLTMQGEFDG